MKILATADELEQYYKHNTAHLARNLICFAMSDDTTYKAYLTYDVVNCCNQFVVLDEFTGKEISAEYSADETFLDDYDCSLLFIEEYEQVIEDNAKFDITRTEDYLMDYLSALSNCGVDDLYDYLSKKDIELIRNYCIDTLEFCGVIEPGVEGGGQ